MTDALRKMRDFVASYPDADILAGLVVDYTDRVPDNAGIFPAGLVEVARERDLLGNVTVTNQYNFALYAVLAKAPGDDAGATFNAEWLMGFQEWVQTQSALGLAPTFGDRPRWESMQAQNGQLYSAEDEGTALYVMQITVQFIKEYWRQ